MNTTEKFCLKWNDFKENVSNTFGTLRDNIDFADVTLASEDGHQMEAHKVILAASSPFFHNLLRQNKHPHPLIYMRGIKSDDLMAIVDFLYHGEVSVYQENLDSFLVIAAELELKGLTKEENKSQEENNLIELPSQYEKTEKRPQQRLIHEIKTETPYTLNENTFTNIEGNDSKSVDRTISLRKEILSGDLQELDAQVKSMWMIIKRDGKSVYTCNVCAKEGTAFTNIRDHIEANHIQGISLPCNFCEKKFRSRASLRMHNSRDHKN